MARTFPLYLSVGTSKYGYTGIGKYGFFTYGWNYPPPTPENLTVLGGPVIVDGTPYFSWTNPTFSWEVPYGDGDPLYYEIQIAFNDPTFTTLDADTNEFQSAGRFYHLGRQRIISLHAGLTMESTIDDYSWAEMLCLMMITVHFIIFDCFFQLADFFIATR